MRLAQLVAQCKARLAEAGIADAAFDARMLVLSLLGLETKDLLIKGDQEIAAADVARIEGAIRRRLGREPVHRILGEREFRDLRLKLSPGTLEPRPDTEVLVEALLPLGQEIAQRVSSPRLLDLGTGTGAIALALLHELPQFTGLGVDISTDALETAKVNADLNGMGQRFTTLESWWFEHVTGRFDIIVSNPPYIETGVIPQLEPEVRMFDPHLALDGGKDGLDAYRNIASAAGDHLEHGGIIAVEIGYDQKQTVTAIFISCGYTLECAVRDYGGNDRVLVFARKSDDSATV